MPGAQPLDVTTLRKVVEQALAQPPSRRSLPGRVADTFRGWFGPGTPPAVIAPAGTEPRQWDFSTSTNLQSTPRAEEPVTFQMLRQLADACTILRSGIETCKDDFDRLAWVVKPRDPAVDPAKDSRIAEITAFLLRPDRRHTFKTWLRMLLEDLMVIDAPAVYIRPDRAGRPFAFEPIDGATIIPNIDATGRTPLDGPAYHQVVKGMRAVPFTSRELVYAPRNPRTNKRFGFGNAEQLLITVNIALRREVGQLEYFTAGNIPDVLIPAPPEWTNQQIKDANLYWDQYRGDTAKRRGITVVPAVGPSGIKEVRLPPIKDEFDEWLARCVMFNLALPPTWFTKVGMNRATAETMQDTSVEQGLVPRMLWAADFLSELIGIGFDAPDLCFEWADIRDPDPKQQAEVGEIDVRAGVRSINEVRAERKLPGIPGGDVPFLMTATGPIPLDSFAPDARADEATDAAAVPVAEPALPQIGAMLEVVSAVSGGTLAPEAAVAVLVAAFPTLGETEARRIVAGAQPKEPEPVPVPPDDTPPPPPDGGGTPDPSDEADTAEPSDDDDAEDEALAAATGVRRKTVAGLSRRKRGFWQAERAPVPPRARPSAGPRGRS
jgi:hypothetical protein